MQHQNILQYNTIKISNSVIKNLTLASSTPSDEKVPSNDDSSKSKNTSVITPSESSNKNENKSIVDKSTSSSILPKTGINYVIIIAIVVVAIVWIIAYNRCKAYKDVK